MAVSPELGDSVRREESAQLGEEIRLASSAIVNGGAPIAALAAHGARIAGAMRVIGVMGVMGVAMPAPMVSRDRTQPSARDAARSGAFSRANV